MLLLIINTINGIEGDPRPESCDPLANKIQTCGEGMESDISDSYTPPPTPLHLPLTVSSSKSTPRRTNPLTPMERSFPSVQRHLIITGRLNTIVLSC